MIKKLFLLVSLIIIPFVLQAQKIEKDYYDQFTGKRIMYTKLEKINWKYKNKRIGGKMQLRFILNDNFQYVVLHWHCNKFLDVAANAKVQFKLDNGATITLTNEAATQAIKGGTGVSKNDVGITLNCIGDIPKFATALVTAIRIYTNEGYYDFDIDVKESEKIHKMYMLFSREVHVGG